MIVTMGILRVSFATMTKSSRFLVPFLNLGHLLDHLVMLVFPTVVIALGREWGRPYSELLPLALSFAPSPELSSGEVALVVAGPGNHYAGGLVARSTGPRSGYALVLGTTPGAELVLGKASGIPAARVRGLDLRGEGRGVDLVMPRDRDLFR